jgi:hypothetical protein
MKIRGWINRKWKRFLYSRGWRRCPCCRKFTRIKWVKDVIYFEDEPPLFSHWECSNCGATTPSAPTWLTLDAVESLGYESFDDYCQKLLKNGRKQQQ